MSAVSIVKNYSIRREKNDVNGLLTLLTADVVLTVNGKKYEGLVVVRKYLAENFVPAISLEEPVLLPDGRVKMNLKVKKFFFTIPVCTIFTLRGLEISHIDVTASLV